MTGPAASLWACERCGRAFAHRNQSHACGRWTLDPHFAGKPAMVRAIYERFLAMLERFGPVTVLPEKTRIAFQVRMSFAQLTVRRQWVLAHLVLAVPVLAGSAAYAVGEARRWPVGLDRKPRRAKAFYGTIVAATAIGALMNFSPIDPIRALIVAAIINGIVSVPVMAVMMLVSARQSVMGVFAVTGPLLWIGWLATAVMAAAVGAMVYLSI